MADSQTQPQEPSVITFKHFLVPSKPVDLEISCGEFKFHVHIEVISNISDFISDILELAHEDDDDDNENSFDLIKWHPNLLRFALESIYGCYFSYCPTIPNLKNDDIFELAHLFDFLLVKKRSYFFSLLLKIINQQSKWPLFIDTVKAKWNPSLGSFLDEFKWFILNKYKLNDLSTKLTYEEVTLALTLSHLSPRMKDLILVIFLTNEIKKSSDFRYNLQALQELKLECSRTHVYTYAFGHTKRGYTNFHKVKNLLTSLSSNFNWIREIIDHLDIKLYPQSFHIVRKFNNYNRQIRSLRLEQYCTHEKYVNQHSCYLFFDNPTRIKSEINNLIHVSQTFHEINPLTVGRRSWMSTPHRSRRFTPFAIEMAPSF